MTPINILDTAKATMVQSKLLLFTNEDTAWKEDIERKTTLKLLIPSKYTYNGVDVNTNIGDDCSLVISSQPTIANKHLQIEPCQVCIGANKTPLTLTNADIGIDTLIGIELTAGISYYFTLQNASSDTIFPLIIVSNYLV